MANTFYKISRVDVGSGGSSTIQFTSIPQTYTDLLILASSRTNRADVKDYIAIRPNGNTSNDTCRGFNADGSTKTYDSEAAAIVVATNGNTATTSVFGNTSIYIFNYATSKIKHMTLYGVSENNATENRMQVYAGLWNDTTAITSIDLVPFIGSLFNEYSSFTLYGIKSS